MDTVPVCKRCNVRIGATASVLKCRCAQIFCDKHRPSNAHECSYDWKAHGRQELSGKLPGPSDPEPSRTGLGPPAPRTINQAIGAFENTHVPAQRQTHALIGGAVFASWGLSLVMLTATQSLWGWFFSVGLIQAVAMLLHKRCFPPTDGRGHFCLFTWMAFSYPSLAIAAEWQNFRAQLSTLLLRRGLIRARMVPGIASGSSCGSMPMAGM